MSWLDSMPSSWELRSPKSLFNERRTSNLPDDVHLTPSQKYGVLPQSEYIELTGGSVVLNLTGQNAMKHVEPNDFIIHLRSFQGGLEHARQSGKVSTAYTVVEPKNATNPEFYKWLLKSKAFIQELQTTTNQLRDGQSIRWTDFVKVPLPTPPLDEQRAIADYLDRETQKIDELIAEQRGLIETLRERRVELIAKGVTRGIDEEPLSESPMPWIGAIPRGWSIGRIKHLGQVTLGKMLQSQGKQGYVEAPYMRAANIQPDGVVSDSDFKTMWFSPSELRSLDLCQGDVVVVEGGVGGYGRAAFLSKSLHGWGYQNSVNRIRPFGDGRFIAYYLQAVRAKGLIKAYCNIVSMPHLTAEKLESMPVPIPPDDEQCRIANYLDDQTSRIDELISESEDLITLSEERRAALITAAVTGQIDVREGV